MAVYKSRSSTADGKCWFFKTQYTIFGNDKIKTMISKKYSTNIEAMEAEHDFLIKMFEHKDVPIAMTFKELYQNFLKYKKAEVKFTTYQGYSYSIKHFKCFMNTKCMDYNLQQYEKWKNNINKTKLSSRCKNDLLKFWKSVLNYGTNYYGFNFSQVYRRMSNFTNPNEKKKEMLFYTLKEFKKYITAETELKYKCLWKTLFFCGLRCGEARGLMWECVDFNKKLLIINKQVQESPKDSNQPYIISNPKTVKSNRAIPLNSNLLLDLELYKNQIIRSGMYSEKNFVFGNDFGSIPYKPEYIRKRAKEISEKAKVKQIRLHDFRHSCASLLINSGANVTMVSKYLGHSEVEETLNTYSHLFPSALDNVLDIINELNNKNKTRIMLDKSTEISD